VDHGRTVHCVNHAARRNSQQITKDSVKDERVDCGRKDCEEGVGRTTRATCPSSPATAALSLGGGFLVERRLGSESETAAP
jgi:hypothetical protein